MKEGRREGRGGKRETQGVGGYGIAQVQHPGLGPRLQGLRPCLPNPITVGFVAAAHHVAWCV